MRLFVGIPLSPETYADLGRVVARMKPRFVGWRWSQPESWHITLQFLGATRPDQLEPLTAQLHTIQSPFVPIRLGGLDLFDRTGVLFVDVTISPELAALQKKVERATAPCGFVAESRPYHPHMTLARLKGGVRNRSRRNAIAGPHRFSAFTASEFLLYESFLSLSGSRYEIRERFSLIER